MKKLRSENKAISPIAFSEKYEWIWDIASFTFSTKDFELCQDIIIEEHNRRKIKTICENVAFMCQDDKKTASELATMISDGLTLETKEDADNLFPLAFDTFDKIFQQNESIYVINTT
jgi:hypothetical protein